MSKWSLIGCLLLAAGLFAGEAMASGGKPMSGKEIERTIKGKRIFLAAPMGGEFPLNYRSNGVVDGDGKAVGLGRLARPTDSGRWWVEGNKLCQKWQRWYDGKPFCFTLARGQGATLYWVRDDGLSGEARIDS